MSKILLNPEQVDAINTSEGNLLILASAGTGKTTTIVERYVNLVENQGISPNQIMMTTFTNKAAKDMIGKIKKKTDKLPYFIGTMHSLFLKILRDHAEKLNINSNFTLLTEESDKKKLVKLVLLEKNIEPTKNNISYLLRRIEQFKNRGINSDDLDEVLDAEEEKLVEEEIEGEFVRVTSSIKRLANFVYKKYQQKLRSLNKLDFDDILLFIYILLDKNKELREEYKNKFKAIMVDEAQDLNIVQRNILELLQSNNLCLIGDDCQNIYAWRGSSNEFIFSFDKSHKKIVLKDNHRSSRNIISNVNKIIDEIAFKIDKKLVCTREDGEVIRIREFRSSRDELSFVAFEIKKLLQSQEKPEDIAILFRTNKIGKQMERILRKNKIPCHLSRAKGFFEREEIRDILSFIKLKINPKSFLDFERLLGLVEGVGKSKLEVLSKIALKEKIDVRGSLDYLDKINLKESTKKSLESLNSILKDNSINPVLSFLNFFEYKLKLEKKYHDTPEKIEDKLENIGILEEFVKDYEFSELGIREFLDSLIDLERKENDKNKIVLTTIHSAKGLEWKHVYLVGCNENILPSYRGSLSKIKRDDELRLFYVAVSRAKDFLTITYSLFKDFENFEPSQFLEIIEGDFER